jgi:hypothetical protein
MRLAQPPGNWLRRPATVQTAHHAAPQLRPHRRFPHTAPAPFPANFLGTNRIVTSCGPVSRHLTRNRRDRTLSFLCEGSQAFSLHAAPVNDISFTHTQLTVFRSHPNTLLQIGCCTSFWSPPAIEHTP